MMDFNEYTELQKKITSLRLKLSKEEDNSKKLIINYEIDILENKIKILRLKN